MNSATPRPGAPLPTFESFVQQAAPARESYDEDKAPVGNRVPLGAYPGATKLAVTLFNKYATLLFMDKDVRLPSSSGKRLAAMLRKEGCPEQDSMYNGYKMGSFFEFNAETYDTNFLLSPPHESDKHGEWRLYGRDRGWGCTSSQPRVPTYKAQDARDTENQRRRAAGRPEMR